MQKEVSNFDFSDFYDEGFEKTSNIRQAIYVFQDGSMWNGYSEGGGGYIRDVDHGSIEAFFKDSSIDRYHPEYHSMVLSELVQVVPETQTVLTLETNNYSEEQLEMLQQFEQEGFSIEKLESSISEEQEKYVPIQTAEGMSEVFERETKEPLPEEVRPYIEEYVRFISHESYYTYDEMGNEYEEYHINGHSFYVQQAEYEVSKWTLDEELIESLMDGSIRLADAYTEKYMAKLSPEAEKFWKKSIEETNSQKILEEKVKQASIELEEDIMELDDEKFWGELQLKYDLTKLEDIEKAQEETEKRLMEEEKEVNEFSEIENMMRDMYEQQEKEKAEEKADQKTEQKEIEHGLSF